MRRLRTILLCFIATIIVLVALLISALRLALPYANHYRGELLAQVHQLTGIDVSLAKIDARWETAGPHIELYDLSFQLPSADWKVQRITLALDVWQSLLHRRWQFSDLTFYQLNWVDFNVLGGAAHEGSTVQMSALNDFIFRQIDHFTLRDSRLSLLLPSGERTELDVPQLSWLNGQDRHRAEGKVSLSSLNGQHGTLEIRLDLHDNNGLLNNGVVYVQADDVDVKPWLSRWLSQHTGIERANFSLASWLTVQQGSISEINTLLKSGALQWKEEGRTHQLQVDNLIADIKQQENNWLLNVPQLNLKTDQQKWPQSSLAALWMPDAGNDTKQGFFTGEGTLRLRSGELSLDLLSPLLPLASFASPDWHHFTSILKPKGKVESLGLDIPLHQPEKMRFQTEWHDVSWQKGYPLSDTSTQVGTLWPSVSHFSGSLAGSLQRAKLSILLNGSELDFGSEFIAPLAIKEGQAELIWTQDAHGWTLSAPDVSIQAQALWLAGGFHYQHPLQGKADLSLLAGIRLYDASEAPRYYPHSLMEKGLITYLTSALKAGKADNATLIFAGDPADFPFTEHQGQFQVYVPLRAATFAFQPDWPALENFAIDLNFANDGLWMLAPEVALGDAVGKNVHADIPEYQQGQLQINADIAGDGTAIADYFEQTPLQKSVGSALQQLPISGDVSGRLHLDIPLDGGHVQATGDVNLKNNTITIKPLSTSLQQVTGHFRFDNGTLQSDLLAANWFGQPVNIQFVTQENKQDYKIGIGLQGNWAINRLPELPLVVAQKLSGHTSWNSEVNVTLPARGETRYQVKLNSDLKQISSLLPKPAEKTVNEPLMLNIEADGGLKGFQLRGNLGSKEYFNSEWRFDPQRLRMSRGIWLTQAQATPALPPENTLNLHLGDLEGEEWLTLLIPGLGSDKDTPQLGSVALPMNFVLETPALLLAGQHWNQFYAQINSAPHGREIRVKSNELRGNLTLSSGEPWRANIEYLYYNPSTSPDHSSAVSAVLTPASEKNTFRDWPVLLLNCQSCWFMGQRVGAVKADLIPEEDTLRLNNGRIDTGHGTATIEGQWTRNSKGNYSAFKGQLDGASISEFNQYFGISTPLKTAPFHLKFDLNWQGEPWEPRTDTLNGQLALNLGAGELEDMGGGRAGQLLRLVSIDALLRKLRFDFNDTFGQGFYFDAIRGTATIQKGILSTNNLLIDGLEADISLNGTVNFNQRHLALTAVIAPELSATVGVATALAVNPVVGAAVFAASKVLAPLWNKISVIRYHINGSFDKPQVSEAVRQPKEEKTP